MMQKLDEKQILRRAIELERGLGPDDLGFEWFTVPAQPSTLNRMVLEGVLKVNFKSHSSTNYRLAIPPSEAEKLIEREAKWAVEAPKELDIPQDLFDVIESFDDFKFLLLKTLKAKKPVSVLLVGPPSTSKSLFIYELSRIPGARLCLGGSSTKVGIRDMLFEETPSLVLIDEIDKIENERELSSLLSWMQEGKVIVTKHRVHEERTGRGQVVAACNRTDLLPPELLSRFIVFRLRDYTEEEFLRVAKAVLIRREGVDPDLAEYISKKVLGYSRDVRDVVKLARLASTKEEVDKFVEIINRYR